MMENSFIFVLGSNWRLSIAEIDHLLKNSPNRGRIKDYSANIAVVEFEDLEQKENFVNELEEIQFILGGCQKIARIFDFIDIGTIYNSFPERMDNFNQVKQKREKIIKIIGNNLVGTGNIFPKIAESMFYAVSIYPNMFDDKYYPILTKHFLPFLNENIFKILSEKGSKKISYFRYPVENMNDGTLNPIFPHHVIQYELLKENRAEIIFGFTEEGVYIGRTFTADDPNFKKKLDEERPFKDYKSTIPPKLAQILVNFLNIYEKREENKVLDPFVGNGTLIMFAWLQGFQVYGTDVDSQKVKNTIRNINWLYELFDEFIPPLMNEHFRQMDVKNIPKHFEPGFFDGISTEPQLGPYYTEKPYYNEAIELIQEKLEPLIESTMSSANELLKPGCRISLIAPIISTLDGGEVQVDIEKIAYNNDFHLIPLIDSKRIVNKSNNRLQFKAKHLKTLIDAKQGQIIKRKIFLFEKNEYKEDTR